MILNEALAFQEMRPSTDVDWRREEEIEKEIEDILGSINKHNIAEVLKRQLQEKIVKAISKVAKVASKNARPPEEKAVELSVNDAFARGSEEPAPTTAKPGSAAEAATKAESLAIVLMQKKMANLKKNLEIAEHKARSVTMQW